MGDRITIDLPPLPADLQAIADAIETAAQRRVGNELSLLKLLRLLEHLHVAIRDELFLEAMPDNRQRLYALLRDIEINGGWPHIQRMRLRSLLANLEPVETLEGDAEANKTNP